MNIGIIGGGQLAQMMMAAAYPLGVQFTVLDPNPQACALPFAQKALIGAYDDAPLLAQMAQSCDAVTFDFENVPAAALSQLAQNIFCAPNAQALATSQDRLSEKQYFQNLNIPTAPFVPIRCQKDLQNAFENLGAGILKTRRLGYDGKGQYRIHQLDDIADIQIDHPEQYIYEALVAFAEEISIISVRNPQGQMGFYPVSRNQHQNGILHCSVVLQNPHPLQQQAENIAKQVLQDFAYIGILAIEFFVCDNRLLVNEFAPRVHNSGHWSQDGAACSQFENHIRAVANLPIGSTAAHHHSAMLNCVGKMPSAAEVFKTDANAHYHAYGKSAAPLRKLGHINITDSDATTLQSRLQKLENLT